MLILPGTPVSLLSQRLCGSSAKILHCSLSVVAMRADLQSNECPNGAPNDSHLDNADASDAPYDESGEHGASEHVEDCSLVIESVSEEEEAGREGETKRLDRRQLPGSRAVPRTTSCPFFRKS